jgi:hypothetical protein
MLFLSSYSLVASQCPWKEPKSQQKAMRSYMADLSSTFSFLIALALAHWTPAIQSSVFSVLCVFLSWGFKHFHPHMPPHNVQVNLLLILYILAQTPCKLFLNAHVWQVLPFIHCYHTIYLSCCNLPFIFNLYMCDYLINVSHLNKPCALRSFAWESKVPFYA